MTLHPAEAIVLAGGMGTRLRGVLDVPKVLAPIGGRPFLHRLFDVLRAQGVEAIVLATGWAAADVERVAAAYEPLTLSFSRELSPLGTGGAIAQAFTHIRGDRAWVLNGDSFCDVDLRAMSDAATTDEVWLVAVEVEDASRFGTLLLDGTRVVDYREKTGRNERGWINAGIYLLPRSVIGEGASSIERDHFPRWVRENKVRAFPVRGRFIDIGTPESLAAAEAFFA